MVQSYPKPLGRGAIEIAVQFCSEATPTNIKKSVLVYPRGSNGFARRTSVFQIRKISWSKTRYMTRVRSSACLGKALFILHVMIGMLSSHLMQSEIIIYGLVRKCVKLSPFS